MNRYWKFLFVLVGCTALYASGWFGGGYGGKSVGYFTPGAPPAATCTLLADGVSSETIDYNAAATLSWTTTNATTASIDNGIGSVATGSGSRSTGALTATKTYRLTAEGAGGTGNCSATVNVNPPPFSPTDVAGLTLWLKADAIAGKNDGDTVSSWSDSSGNGYNVTTVGSTPPVYKTNIVNGKPVLRFDGANSTWMRGTAIGNIATRSAQTFFVVFKATSISTNGSNSYDNQRVWCEDVYDAQGLYLKSTPTALFGAWDTADRKTSNSISTGSFLIFVGRHDSGNLVSSVNGGSESSVACGDLYSASFGGAQIAIGGFTGGGTTASKTLVGDIAEMLFYNTAVSSGDRTSIIGYLNTKYAIY